MTLTPARMAAITPQWQDWTPTWTTTTGLHLPSYGDAVVNCRWCKTGDLAECNFRIVFGATTNFGASVTSSDNWQFSLPSPGINNSQGIGYVAMDVTGSGTRTLGEARMNSASSFVIDVHTGNPAATATTNTGTIDSLTPYTWGSGDYLRGTLRYELA